MVVTAMSVMSVLTTPVPEDGENATVEQIRNRAKWDNDDYDSLEAKYMAEDALSKKFFVSNFTNYKMSDSRPIMEQYNELFGILGRFTQHKMNMDEAIQDEALDKFKVFKTEVKLQQGSLIKRFRTDMGGEYMDTLYFQTESRVLGAVVRLPDPNLKTLGERGIKCIFDGHVEHSKAFRFYVIEPNETVSNNSINESRDVIFDENRFSSVPRPSLGIPKGTKDICSLVVLEKVTEEVDSKIFDEAMNSQDVAFWKEAINDEIDSIMGNNTWVLADLPLGWSFRALEKKSGIDYFDTYAPVARISTIRMLIVMASIHNLIIHQMDVKTAFLNGKLDKEVYMNQPQGFIMPKNEKKVYKLIKSLYGLKQASKQWHQKFDEVILCNGYLLNQANKCVYSKFDESGKRVIIYLYFDDMLIFGTDQVQVDLTKEFLSSRFSIKDMGEADVILGKHESNGIAISQSHYIEEVLRKFNYFECTPVSTHMDTSEKLMPNNGHAVLKYLKKTMDYRLTYIGYPLVLEGYTDASWINNTMDNSSTSGWVFLLVADKEDEWLKNLLLEIPLWSKPIAPISIHCDSVATLAKAYSQMYNRKSRHLGVRHRMIRELITNGVISIKFMRSQQNLVDHLTNGLDRDLVIKSTKGMGLKSN
ncbi:zinc finger, CCHC-type containing protein [Tanacetum coccineum]